MKKVLYLTAAVFFCSVTHASIPTRELKYINSIIIANAEYPTAGVAFGDIDNDGNLDIVLAKGRHWPAPNVVRFGDGQGGTLKKITLPGAADRSYGGPLIDLDLDGDLDILMGNDNPDQKLIYINDGKGDFSEVRSFGDPNWPTRYCSAADLNLDGAPDIMVANRSSIGSVICFNQKINNRYGNFPMSRCKTISSEPSTSIDSGDFNGDGYPDLVVPNRNGGQSFVYFGPNFSKDDRIPWGASTSKTRIVKVADFNDDGLQDIAAIFKRAGGVSVFYGLGNGKFKEERVDGPLEKPYSMTVGDLNLDGRPDIVVGYVNAKSVALISKQERSQGKWEVISFGDRSGTVYGIAIGDYNSDGRPDIALAKSGAESRIYFASDEGNNLGL